MAARIADLLRIQLKTLLEVLAGKRDRPVGLEVDLAEAGALAAFKDVQHLRFAPATEGVELFLERLGDRLRGLPGGPTPERAVSILKL